ncbi:MAG: hypothetical protein ACREL9_13530 [Gemmatimonadales bacterium]
MYIDPGFGALILQGVVAGIVGVAFVARRKILHFFAKLTGRSPGEPPPEEPPARRPE